MKDMRTYVFVRALYRVNLRCGRHPRSVLSLSATSSLHTQNVEVWFIVSTVVIGMDYLILPNGIAMSTAYVLDLSVP
jgi:hypothetical protein